MDNFNRVISFVLGLVVVIVFLVVLSGRINLRERLLGQGQVKKVETQTPTPTIKTQQYISPSPASQKAVSKTNTTSYNVKSKTPNSIPATGTPTLLVPILLSGLSTGIYLLKKSKG